MGVTEEVSIRRYRPSFSEAYDDVSTTDDYLTKVYSVRSASEEDYASTSDQYEINLVTIYTYEFHETIRAGDQDRLVYTGDGSTLITVNETIGHAYVYEDFPFIGKGTVEGFEEFKLPKFVVTDRYDVSETTQQSKLEYLKSKDPFDLYESIDVKEKVVLYYNVIPERILVQTGLLVHEVTVGVRQRGSVDSFDYLNVPPPEYLGGEALVDETSFIDFYKPHVIK